MQKLPAGGGQDSPAEVLALRYRVQAAFLPRSLLIFGGRLGSGCAVLRTASASISYSSALVLGAGRLDGCHWVMDNMWGCWGRITPQLGR